MTDAMSTILVVEDEESFVEALTVGLKREGFRVVVARDGAEAIALFESARPDHKIWSTSVKLLAPIIRGKLSGYRSMILLQKP